MYPVQCSTGAGYVVYNGSTLIAETNTSGLIQLAALASEVPSSLTFTSNITNYSFFAIIRTALETGVFQC